MFTIEGGSRSLGFLNLREWVPFLLMIAFNAPSILPKFSKLRSQDSWSVAGFGVEPQSGADSGLRPMRRFSPPGLGFVVLITRATV